MKRQRYIGHGMKMYLNCAETRAWCEHVREHLPQDRRTLVFFYPSLPVCIWRRTSWVIRMSCMEPEHVLGAQGSV